ncbi:MAG TPA: SusC/RagA family TonB-linked outer membrane protein [Flavitalea sp.]|nr:SusC/RagA family TonB-linked outer membrane protein [Flavitalea sp.]
MSKHFRFLILFILLAFQVLAQDRTVTGTVTSRQDGSLLEGVSIKVDGTETGTSTDNKGRYSILVPAGKNTLVFTYLSFAPESVETGNRRVVDVSLALGAENLNEVVVTAFGINRAKNTLPYATQQVKGEEISGIRGNNIASALSGKVSGLQITQGNSLGGSTNIVIRGSKSLSGDNQALFVVDGVPIDNTNKNTSGQTTGRGGYDYGNAAADINPDDVESINVLKGAAASALYGSRAANGVIMITTKKGKKGLGVTINSGLLVGTMDKKTFPKYQTQYGAGYSDPYQKDGFLYFDVNGDGVKDLVAPTAQNASYGTAFDPNLLVYQWDAFGDPSSPYYKKPRPWVAGAHGAETFYETAVSTNNSIMVDGASDKGAFKLGFTRTDDRGILPNSKIVKNIVNFSSTYNLTNKLTANASVNYSKVDGLGRYGSGYDKKNVNMYFRQFYQMNIDIQDQKDAYFRTPNRNFTTNWSDPSLPEESLKAFHANNFYWTRYQNFENDTRTRTFGNVSLNYKATDWLNFLARISVDSYNEFQEERMAVYSSDPASYSRLDRTFSETNYDLLANFNKDLSEDFKLSALAGVNMRRSKVNSVASSTSGGLIVPGLYSISNSTGTIPAPTEVYQQKSVDGYFGGVTLTYRNFLTLDGTIRRDRSSTLPVDENAYNYYAISGSWLFSDHLKDVSWLSSGKLRANYATVGNDAPWGSILDIYNKPQPFGTTLLFAAPTTQNNSTLKPEKTTSRELGLEVSFLNNRVGFDVSYYNTNTVNQIIPVAVSSATGYSNKYVNAGDIQNKGFEVSVYGTPVKTKNFSWSVNINWTRNRNKVLALYNDSKNLQLGSFQNGVTINASLGEPYGTIQGKTWNYLDGQRLVLPNGRYSITSTTTNVIGNINPDWIGGIYNSFRYKAFTFGFLIDVKQGGDVYTLDMDYGGATGIYPESAGLNDLGNPSRNTIANGGGVILPGVKADGKPNDIRVENITGTFGYTYNPNSAAVYDASFVKLREMVLSYAIPAKVYSKLNAIKGIDISLIGRNVWLIHKNLPYADPEENLSSGNTQGSQSGAYPTTRTIGVNLKLRF